MFWNKKKPKSKPQIKTTVPKAFKAKEPPPKWQPTFGETKKKDEKPPEVITKLAGFIKIGNSITDPMSTDDSSEKYWYTPMYFSDVWSTRRMLRQINKLFGKGDDE